MAKHSRWEPTDIERFLGDPVADISKRAPRFVEATATVGEVIEVLQTEGIGSVLVRGGDGSLAGIFTERDVLTRVLGGRCATSTPVAEVMTTEPETLESTATIAMALNKMHLGDYRHLPLVDEDDTPMGFVSVKDLVAHLAGRLA